MSAAMEATIGATGRRVELAEPQWAGYLHELSLAYLGAATLLYPRDDPSRPFSFERSIGMPLRELRYDREGDLLELAVGGTSELGAALRCFVPAPRRLLSGKSASWHSILILNDAGGSTLMRIARPSDATRRSPTGRVRVSAYDRVWRHPLSAGAHPRG
jgi:hypothetical protein